MVGQRERGRAAHQLMMTCTMSWSTPGRERNDDRTSHPITPSTQTHPPGLHPDTPSRPPPRHTLQASIQTL